MVSRKRLHNVSSVACPALAQMVTANARVKAPTNPPSTSWLSSGSFIANSTSVSSAILKAA